VVPRPGLVIRYAYVWRDEAGRGREEGKDRPCAVVLATKNQAGRLRVYVVPVTHSPPDDPRHAIEIPADTKRRLGLDEARSWIKTTELNVFTWPGPDLRPIGRPGAPRGVAYGFLPKNMAEDLIANVRDRVRDGRARAVNRDEARDDQAQ
jgi:mRNA-degrading endonuclease toxin of MazEF toxin-antitoxin module